MDRAAVPVVVAYLCSSETKHSVSIWTSSTTRGVVVTPIECFFSRSQSRPPSIRSIGGALSRFDSARASLVKVPVVISRPYSPRPSTTPWVWALALVLLGLGAGAAQTGATGLLLAAVPPARIVTATVVWSQLGILGYLIAPAAGGLLAQHLGYAALGLLPATTATLLAILATPTRRHP